MELQVDMLVSVSRETLANLYQLASWQVTQNPVWYDQFPCVLDGLAHGFVQEGDLLAINTQDLTDLYKVGEQYRISLEYQVDDAKRRYQVGGENQAEAHGLYEELSFELETEVLPVIAQVQNLFIPSP